MIPQRARRMKQAERSPILATKASEESRRTVEVDGHVITLTHLDRVLFPDVGFTKADLVAYWSAIADVILPHLRDRPLTVGRFPSGVGGRGFAQAEVPGRPEWIPVAELKLVKGDLRRFTLVHDRATLVWLAQMGTIELHSFLGLAHDLEHTSTIVFDLDPGAPAGIVEAAEVALSLRSWIEAHGATAYVKTSGSIGIHVYAALASPVSIAEARGIAAIAAREVSRDHPDRVVDQLSKQARQGRVLVDVRQNAARLTMAVPYSLRSTPNATVSTPLTWQEVEMGVEKRDPAAFVFAAGDVLERVERRGDPFAPLVSE